MRYGLMIAMVCVLLAGCAQNNDTSLKASGTVESTEIAIAPEMSGRVMSVDVREGDAVKAGQVLLKLDDALLRAQRHQTEAALAAARANRDLLAAGATPEQIQQAEAALMSAQAAYSRTLESARPSEITAAKASLSAASENYNKVKRGPTAEDIAGAEAAFRSAEAALKQAQFAYDNAFRRDPAGIAGRPEAMQLEQATNAFNAARAQYDKVAKGADDAQIAAALQQVQSAKAALDKAQTPARQYDIQQAQAQVNAAQARLNELLAGARPEQMAAADAQVAAAQAALEVLDTQMQKLTVKAPSDGVLMERSIEPGEMAAAGAPLLHLAQLDDLTITVFVPEDRYGQIQLGQTAGVQSDSFAGQTFTATVQRIADQAEFTPRNVQTDEGRRTTVFAVKLNVNNPAHLLKPGMPVDVIFKQS
jgi:multidrug efflux pump subunit AcrA (membrane-fusion protein)